MLHTHAELPVPSMATVPPFQLLFDLPVLFRNIPEYLRQSSMRRGPLVEFQTGLLPAYFIDHPDLIKHVLQDNAQNYTHDTIQYRALAKVTGQGLLTADGPQWFHHRKLQQPAFSSSRLSQVAPLAVQATQAMLERWEHSAASGKAIDLDQSMMELALEIIGQFLFGLNLRQDARVLTQAVITCLDHIIAQSQNPLALPERFPTPANRRFKRALHLLDQALYALMETRRREGLEGQDLLSLLLRAEGTVVQTGGSQAGLREGEAAPTPLTPKQIRDELLTMLIAGHETVASALTWTFAALLNTPRAYEALSHEVDSVLGKRLPTQADVEKLTYTAQVFAEGLRLYPPAWVITRSSKESDTLWNTEIPAGSLIIISPYAVGRNPAYWEDPDEFRPERFQKYVGDGKRGVRGPLYTWIPYGAGPRVCIGAQLAQLEAVLILAQVVQRFQLAAVRPGLPRLQALVTLRPQGGLPVLLTSRATRHVSPHRVALEQR